MEVMGAIFLETSHSTGTMEKPQVLLGANCFALHGSVWLLLALDSLLRHDYISLFIELQVFLSKAGSFFLWKFLSLSVGSLWKISFSRLVHPICSLFDLPEFLQVRFPSTFCNWCPWNGLTDSRKEVTKWPKMSFHAWGQ